MHCDYIYTSRLHLLPPDNVPTLFLTAGLNDIPSTGVFDHLDHIDELKHDLLPPDQLLHPPVAHWSPSSMSLCWNHGVGNANEHVLA